MRENIEEVLEYLWTLNEKGGLSKENIDKKYGERHSREYLELLSDKKLIELKDNQVSLTSKGETKGREIIRRHRLAELLFAEVLDMPENQYETTACRFEHILNPAVTNNICTFLGHPPVCPHGRPIPEGECCKKFTKEIKPLATRLTELISGDSGKIMFITPKYHTRIDRLGSLGLMPGSIIKLHQKKPAIVIGVGETTIALDDELAKEIFVRKI